MDAIRSLLCKNQASPRMVFQWYYMEEYYGITAAPQPGSDVVVVSDVSGPGGGPSVLNIGSSDDPLEFGELAHHYDIDDWSGIHKWFTQGDAHSLPFPDGSFNRVIMGDIHEHLYDPLKATLEAARVIAPGGKLIMTIFEEWRLPGPGQWIEEGDSLAAAEINRITGRDYETRSEYEIERDPRYTPVVANEDVPHLNHINQFTDEAIAVLIRAVMDHGFELEVYTKVPEATHEGHTWFNWLICLVRKDGGDE